MRKCEFCDASYSTQAEGYMHGCWAIVFLDHADHAHSLAYHDLTPEGYPQSKVFVKTTLAHKQAVSVVVGAVLRRLSIPRSRMARLWDLSAADIDALLAEVYATPKSVTDKAAKATMSE